MSLTIDNNTALNLLMKRLESWQESHQEGFNPSKYTDEEYRKLIDDERLVYRLYEKMYEYYLESGVFDEGEYTIMGIVDDDWVNYTNVIAKGDNHYDEIIEAINKEDPNYLDEKENSMIDISSEVSFKGIVEAMIKDNEDNPVFLIRY